MTDENREQLKQAKAQRSHDCRQRISIEGMFCRVKSAYRLNYIRDKRTVTTFA